jgi:hypothetical protein
MTNEEDSRLRSGDLEVAFFEFESAYGGRTGSEELDFPRKLRTCEEGTA